ncbi:MAG: cysteine desulfurase family protein [archaeon]
MKVYLDNGATTMVDSKIVSEMKKIMISKYGNPSSIHAMGEESKKLLEQSRNNIAKRINALPEEVLFTSGGTESNNLAIFSLISEDKKHIIITAIEHPSVRETCKHLAREGYSITFVQPNAKGIVEVESIVKEINPETGLIVMMHANNEIGTLQPVEEVGKICAKNKINFHVDAVQSFTKVDIDVVKMKITSLAVSSHKIHGPKGVGALFIKKGVKVRKMLFGGHQERNLRAGTENLPGIYGFGMACKEKQPVAKIKKLRDRLIDGILKEIPDTFLNGSRDSRLCNNANISFKFIEGEGLLMHLDMNGIYVSTGSACSSKSLEPSHVLLALGLSHEEAHGSIRFTLSKYTTEKEIDYTIKTLKELVKKLRRISPLGK